MGSGPDTASGLVAVVTGSARGIGLATVERLARDGFAVRGWDRDGDDNAAALAALRDAGLDVGAAAIDICDRNAVAQAFDALGTVNVLVNNAGVFGAGAVLDITDDAFRHMMEVNVMATFIMSQEAARRMEPGGRIINITSRAAVGAPGYAHYVTSKAAVIGLTRAMAIDLRDRQISVNAIGPGMVDTRLTREALPPDLFAKTMATQPGGVMAQPDVIAHAVAFLASPATSYINGQTLFLDGGKSLGGIGI